MASFGTLTAKLALDSAAFIRDMTRAQRSVASNTAQMRRSMQQVERASRNVQRQFGQLRNAAGALAGALAVRQFSKFTTAALETGDAIAKQAKQLQFAAAELQRYRIEGELAGVATVKLDSGIGAFVKRVGELRAGTGTLVTILDKSNVALKEQLLAASGTEEGMRIMLRAIREAGSAFDKQALSAAAFGRQAGQAMVLLAESAGTLDAAMVRTITRSDEMLAASERLNDQMTLLKAAFSAGFDTAIVEGLSGSIEASADAMTEARAVGERFGRIVATAMLGVVEAARFVAENIRAITAALAALAALKAAAIVVGVARAMTALAVAMKAAAVSGGLLNAIMAGSRKGLIGIAAAAATAGAVFALFGDDAKAAIEEAEAALRSFGGSATVTVDEAAASAKTYTDELKVQRDHARALAKAHTQGAAAVEHVTAAIEIHKRELAEGTKFTKERVREMHALILETRKHEQAIAATQKAQDEAARRAKEAGTEASREAEKITDDIVRYAGDTFADMFSDTEFSWKKMWENLRQTAIQTLAKMAAEVALRPIIAPIVASFMGAGGAAAGGGASAVGVGGGAGGMGGLGSLFQMGSAANNAGLFGNTFSGIGSSIGGFLNTPLYSTQVSGLIGTVNVPGLTVGGALGAAGLGAMGGGLIAQLTGGNQLGGSIGGGLGAVAGTIIGGPIGGIIGGAAGGFIGGMFGPGKSVGPIGHTNIVNRGGQLAVGSTGVDNGATAAATMQQAQQAVQAINSLARQLNLTVASAGPGMISQGAASGPQSAQAFVDQFIASGGFTAGDPIIARALRSGLVTAGTIEGDVALARTVSDLENGVTALDKAIRGVTEAYAAQIDRAKALGIETAKLAQIRDMEIEAVKAEARTPFVQAASGIVDFLRQQSFSAASTMTAPQRLVEAQRQFGAILRRVREGEAGLSGSLTQAAGQLLDIGRANYASTVDFANLEGFVRSNLLSVADTLVSDDFFDAQVEATRQQTDVLGDKLTALDENLDRLRGEIRLLGQRLEAA